MDAEQLRSAARLGTEDEEWKEEDPNFPKSPWWFTSDPSRGVGFRLFRSYKPLDQETDHEVLGSRLPKRSEMTSSLVCEVAVAVSVLSTRRCPKPSSK